MDGQNAQEVVQQASVDQTSVDQTSAEYLGRWNRLVSTTNWEKGRIIFEWRTALLAADARPTECSDEAWSQRAGNVSSQHVGRLRRVHERFADARDSFPGLFWSHFQAALDWQDAEMWLEGAVRSDWSVSAMRRQRWETLGSLPAEEPQSKDIVSADYDEDVEPSLEGPLTAQDRAERADFEQAFDGDEQPEAADGPVPFDADSAQPFEAAGSPPPRNFAHLGQLPDDLAEAFESFKLAIVRHRIDGWRDVPLDDVLAALDALKSLAMSPSEGV
ncbi:MAG: hypothetical protein AB7O62_19360 [Pirellulales bacterium]